jgi:hypothetical protein
MDKDYRQVGMEAYGERCEICGYTSSVEVHHTHYQEHQALEDRLRHATRNGMDLSSLLEEGKASGWNYFDKKSLQLDKGKRSSMLSVLCGNCHTLMHKMDVGLKLLKAIKPRK